jgi:SHOCT-like protein
MVSKQPNLPEPENHKRKVLDMVSDGKITADEAAKLLEAMNPKHSKSIKLGNGKKLIVQIIKEGAAKPKVNIAIPLKLAQFGLNFIPKNGKFDAHIGKSDVDLFSVNWQEILALAASGEVGELFYMEVEDEDETPTIIRVCVE